MNLDANAVRGWHESNVNRLTRIETMVELHLQQCDRRAAVAQKLLWLAVSTNMVVLGTLLKIVMKL